jgi:hypothetical protein
MSLAILNQPPRRKRMGTAHDFDVILKRELNIHAAWLPVTNTFRLGDYGLVSDGTLVAVGNIRDDFGVNFTQALGPDAQLDFASKGTSMVRVAGGATVQQFPGSDVEAKLKLEFERERSFLVKVKLTVSQMQGLNEVAAKLNTLPQWDSRFRVVSALYTGTSCVLISSKAAGSKIELSGKANALQQLDLGATFAGVQVTTRSEIGLEIVGKKGVVGLSLFKLGWWNPLKLLGPGEEMPIETLKDWPDTLPDDV